MHGRRVAVHRVTARHDFGSRLEVQGAVEVGFGAPRIHPHGWCCPERCPDRRRGRLQVQCGFIFGQDDGVGCVLGRIDQFFRSDR